MPKGRAYLQQQEGAPGWLRHISFPGQHAGGDRAWLSSGEATGEISVGEPW